MKMWKFLHLDFQFVAEILKFKDLFHDAFFNLEVLIFSIFHLSHSFFFFGNKI